MKIARALPFLAVAIAGVTGCATLFGAGPVPVAFQSDTPGAEVWIDGIKRGVTPVTISLDNKKPVTVTFKQAGREDYTVQIGTQVRAGYLVLDVLGGLIPVVVDASTGEWKTLDQKIVNGNLAAAKATQAGTAKP